MSSKKFMNDPASIVDEALKGFVATHPGLSLLPEHRVVFRSDAAQVKDKQVAVICGGGSGHEPAHIGYVGKGMLSAAVCGDVFASPTARQVQAALMTCAGAAGALLVIKCYTGDRLNFTVAAERARAEGIPVEVVVIGEDVAMSADTVTIAGRRGLCGTVLAYKVAGAMAEEGASLADVAEVCRKAAGQMGSLNVALGPCCAPGKTPSFDIPEGKMELGLGIHGEAGCERTALKAGKAVVEGMVDMMLSQAPDRGYLAIGKGDTVVLVVNNLGATTAMELSLVTHEALQCLEARGAVVQRAYVGALMTALDMPGMSLTLLKTDNGLLKLLDAPTTASGWPSHAANHVPTLQVAEMPASRLAPSRKEPTSKAGPEHAAFKKALLAVCQAIDAAEPELTRYDKIVGDGDCGTTLQKGALAVIKAVDEGTVDVLAPDRALKDISGILEDGMGGTSGALYCIGLDAAAAAIQQKDPNDPTTWAAALDAATNAVMQIGARKGDRTMVDALVAACDCVAATAPVDAAAFQKVARAAEEGAKATANMTAGAGRSTYVSKDIYHGTPDPGAMAVAVWLKAAVAALQ